MKTATVPGKHLFSFRTQKLSPSRLFVVVSVKRQSKDAVFDFLSCRKSIKGVNYASLMKELSKVEAKEVIDNYFSKSKLKVESTKKIKKLAMKYRISLKDQRKKFCKKCFNDLSKGKIRVSRTYKNVVCFNCRTKNRWKIK